MANEELKGIMKIEFITQIETDEYTPTIESFFIKSLDASELVINVKFTNIYDVSAYSIDKLKITFGKQAYNYFVSAETFAGI